MTPLYPFIIKSEIFAVSLKVFTKWLQFPSQHHHPEHRCSNQTGLFPASSKKLHFPISWFFLCLSSKQVEYLPSPPPPPPVELNCYSLHEVLLRVKTFPKRVNLSFLRVKTTRALCFTWTVLLSILRIYIVSVVPSLGYKLTEREKSGLVHVNFSYKAWKSAVNIRSSMFSLLNLNTKIPYTKQTSSRRIIVKTLIWTHSHDVWRKIFSVPHGTSYQVSCLIISNCFRNKQTKKHLR